MSKFNAALFHSSPQLGTDLLVADLLRANVLPRPFTVAETYRLLSNANTGMDSLKFDWLPIQKEMANKLYLIAVPGYSDFPMLPPDGYFWSQPPQKFILETGVPKILVEVINYHGGSDGATVISKRLSTLVTPNSFQPYRLAILHYLSSVDILPPDAKVLGHIIQGVAPTAAPSMPATANIPKAPLSQSTVPIGTPLNIKANTKPASPATPTSSSKTKSTGTSKSTSAAAPGMPTFSKPKQQQQQTPIQPGGAANVAQGPAQGIVTHKAEKEKYEHMSELSIVEARYKRNHEFLEEIFSPLTSTTDILKVERPPPELLARIKRTIEDVEVSTKEMKEKHEEKMRKLQHQSSVITKLNRKLDDFTSLSELDEFQAELQTQLATTFSS